jgi:hypothetical protein
MLIHIDFKIEFLESLGRCFPKFEKPMFARKPIWLQQNFVLAVVNYIAGEMLRFGMLAYVLVHGWHHISNDPAKRAPTHPA